MLSKAWCSRVFNNIVIYFLLAHISHITINPSLSTANAIFQGREVPRKDYEGSQLDILSLSSSNIFSARTKRIRQVDTTIRLDNRKSNDSISHDPHMSHSRLCTYSDRTYIYSWSSSRRVNSVTIIRNKLIRHKKRNQICIRSMHLILASKRYEKLWHKLKNVILPYIYF